jgi:hypothetical protein
MYNNNRKQPLLRAATLFNQPDEDSRQTAAESSAACQSSRPCS